MLAYFGTDVDRGEGAVRVDVDEVEGVGVERSDKKQCLNLLEVDSSCDSPKEVGVDELFTGVPDVVVLLVDDRVLVGVVVVGGEARWGSEEVGEGNEIGSERSKEGSWGWWGRRGDSGDRGFNNGWGDVLNWDVFKVNDFTWELKLCPIVLSEQGKEAVKFGLGKTDDVSGGLFTKLFEVKLGHGTKSFEGGLWGRQGWGSDDVGVGVNGAGFKGVWVNKEDIGVGGQGGVDRGGRGSNKRKTRDDELGAGRNDRRPGYGGGLGAAGVLEAGASRAWVVPRVVGTVEDVVDNLEGSGRVGLIDFVQVGPESDGEGRGRH